MNADLIIHTGARIANVLEGFVFFILPEISGKPKGDD